MYNNDNITQDTLLIEASILITSNYIVKSYRRKDFNITILILCIYVPN